MLASLSVYSWGLRWELLNRVLIMSKEEGYEFNFTFTCNNVRENIEWLIYDKNKNTTVVNGFFWRHNQFRVKLLIYLMWLKQQH